MQSAWVDSCFCGSHTLFLLPLLRISLLTFVLMRLVVCVGVCVHDLLFPSSSPDYADACVKFVAEHSKTILRAIKHRLHSSS